MAQSIERIDIGGRNTRNSHPAHDPRWATAHAIFAQLVQVAETPGVVPRLFITASDPGISPGLLPFNGWIILSKGVLDICDRANVGQGLAWRLCWRTNSPITSKMISYMRFFDALKSVQTPTLTAPAFVDELRRSTAAITRTARGSASGSTGYYLYHDGRATPPGHCLADQGVNFVDWVRALDPRRIIGVAAEHIRPTPQERAALPHHLAPDR